MHRGVVKEVCRKTLNAKVIQTVQPFKNENRIPSFAVRTVQQGGQFPCELERRRSVVFQPALKE